MLKQPARRILPVLVIAALLVPPTTRAAPAGPSRPTPTPHALPAVLFELPRYLPWLEQLAARADSDERYWRRNLVTRFVLDQPYALTTWFPAELDRVGFVLPVTIASVVAARAGSDPNSFDRTVSRRAQGWTTGPVRRVAQVFTEVGRPLVVLALLSATYGAARKTGNVRLERAASLSGEALANSAFYVGNLKRIFRRTRPVAGGTGEFFVTFRQTGQSVRSHPSGHASGAFAVAAVFAQEYRDHGWVPWVAYGTAGGIALSRVALGRHWPSDIVSGAVLGDSLGRMVYQRSREAGDGRETAN